jgi:hypothetical protein
VIAQEKVTASVRVCTPASMNDRKLVFIRNDPKIYIHEQTNHNSSFHKFDMMHRKNIWPLQMFT